MMRSPPHASAILSGNPQDGPHRLRTGPGGKGAMRRLASLFVSVMLALGTFAWISPAPVVFAQDSGYAPDSEEWAFVELLNTYRGQLGLAPVTLNYELGAAAKYHSVDMATNNYFDHYLFDGTDAGTNIQNFGYTGFPYAENIAAGMATAQEVMIGWQNSPEHNATMTDPQYTEIGIGRYYNEASLYGWYWTATYGAGEAPQTAPEPLPALVEVTDPTLVTETIAPETIAPETETTVDEAPTMVASSSSNSPWSMPTATVRSPLESIPSPTAQVTRTSWGTSTPVASWARRSSMSRLPSVSRVLQLHPHPHPLQ